MLSHFLNKKKKKKKKKKDELKFKTPLQDSCKLQQVYVHRQSYNTQQVCK